MTVDWGKAKSVRPGLTDIPIEPSKNITRQEHGDPPPAQKLIVKPVEARKAEVVDDDPEVRTGSVRRPEGRKGSSDKVDLRTLNATERWVQVSTRMTHEWNDDLRKFAWRRKQRGNRRTKLCELLEDALAALIREEEGKT